MKDMEKGNFISLVRIFNTADILKTFIILMLSCRIYGQEASYRPKNRNTMTSWNSQRRSGIQRETTSTSDRRLYPENLNYESTDVNFRRRKSDAFQNTRNNMLNHQRTHYMESPWQPELSTQNGKNDFTQYEATAFTNNRNSRNSMQTNRQAHENSRLPSSPRDKRIHESSQLPVHSGISDVGNAQYRNQHYTPRFSDTHERTHGNQRLFESTNQLQNQPTKRQNSQINTNTGYHRNKVFGKSDTSSKNQEPIAMRQTSTMGRQPIQTMGRQHIQNPGTQSIPTHRNSESTNDQTGRIRDQTTKGAQNVPIGSVKTPPHPHQHHQITDTHSATGLNKHNSRSFRGNPQTNTGSTNHGSSFTRSRNTNQEWLPHKQTTHSRDIPRSMTRNQEQTSSQPTINSRDSLNPSHPSIEPHDRMDTWHDHLDTMHDLRQDQMEASMMFSNAGPNLSTINNRRGQGSISDLQIPTNANQADVWSDHVDTLHDIRQDQIEASHFQTFTDQLTNQNTRSSPPNENYGSSINFRNPEGQMRSGQTTSFQTPEGQMRSGQTTTFQTNVPTQNVNDQPSFPRRENTNEHIHVSRSRPTMALWEGTNKQNARSRSNTNFWESTNNQPMSNQNSRSYNGNSRSWPTTALWEGTNNQQRSNGNVNSGSWPTTALWEGTNHQQRSNGNEKSSLGNGNHDNIRSRSSTVARESTSNQQNSSSDLEDKSKTSSLVSGSGTTNITIDPGMYTRQRISNTRLGNLLSNYSNNVQSQETTNVTTESDQNEQEINSKVQNRNTGENMNSKLGYSTTEDRRPLPKVPEENSMSNTFWEATSQNQMSGPRTNTSPLNRYQGQQLTNPAGQYHPQGQGGTRGENYESTSWSDGRITGNTRNRFMESTNQDRNYEQSFGQNSRMTRYPLSLESNTNYNGRESTSNGQKGTFQGQRYRNQESTYQGQSSYEGQNRPFQGHDYSNTGRTRNYNDGERKKNYFRTTNSEPTYDGSRNSKTKQESKYNERESESETENTETSTKDPEIESSTREMETEKSSTVGHERMQEPGNSRQNFRQNPYNRFLSTDRFSVSDYPVRGRRPYQNEGTPQNEQTSKNNMGIGNVHRSLFEGRSNPNTPRRGITLDRNTPQGEVTHRNFDSVRNPKMLRPSSRFNTPTNVRSDATQFDWPTQNSRQPITSNPGTIKPVFRSDINSHTERSLSVQVAPNVKDIQPISHQYTFLELTTRAPYPRGRSRFSNVNMHSKINYENTSPNPLNSTDGMVQIKPVEQPSSSSGSVTFGIIVGVIVAFWVILGPIICIICKIKDKRKSKRKRLPSNSDRKIEEHELMEVMITRDLGPTKETSDNVKTSPTKQGSTNSINGNYSSFAKEHEELKCLKSQSEPVIHQVIVH